MNLAGKLAIAVAAFSALGSGPALAQDVRIGVIGPFSGPAAASGIAMKRGFELVASEINQNGGITVDGQPRKIALLFEDCQSRPEIGVSAAQKLLNRDNVDVLVAELLHSSVALAIMELAPSFDKVFMSGQPVSMEIANKIKREPQRFKNFWKFDFNSDAWGISAYETVKMLVEDKSLTPRKKTIAFVLEDTDFAKSNMEYTVPFFKQNGWTVSAVETVQIGHADFYPQLAKLRADAPDVIFSIFTAVNSGIAFAKQTKEQAIRSVYIANYYPSLVEFMTGAGKSAEGLVFVPLLFDPKFNAAHKQFSDKMTKYINAPTAMDHAFGACNAEVLFDAIKRAQSTKTEALNAALLKTDYSCVLGRWVFEAGTHSPRTGEKYLALPAAQIQDGNYRVIWPKGPSAVAYRR